MKKLIALAVASLFAVGAFAGELVTSDGKPVVDSQGQVVKTNDSPAQCPSCYAGGA